MGDSFSGPNSNMLPEVRVCCRKKQSITYLAASASKILSQKTVKSFTSAKQHLQGSGVVGDLVLFLAMTAALEVARRFSRAKCPFVWRALQALQVIHFPPFKWLQRWLPFKELAKSTEKLSRPMLVLSIATLFSDETGYSSENSNGANHPQDYFSHGGGSSSQTSGLDIGASMSENWLLQLDEELKKQGIERPERLREDELLRFYAAVNGDFQKLVAAVKKTINWRQSYELLRPQELRAWSHLIFWHGHDTQQRPCLIIRLGLACSTLQSFDMPLLVKAVVSQIEHGVLNLVTVEQPQIMVLMDCFGLSPLGFPINMMRSCATLLQDHYPNRLGSLMIVRLPHLARVVTQTLFQVLKPATRRKVRTLGGNYLEILSECLDSLPPFLGGHCTCSICLTLGSGQAGNGGTSSAQLEAEPIDDHSVDEHLDEIIIDEDRQDFTKTITIAMMVLCVIFMICLIIRLRETLSVIVLEKLM